MSRFFLDAIFAFVALGGLIMLLYGIRMKPDGVDTEIDTLEQEPFEFPCSDDELVGLFESGRPAENLGQGGKEAFDPEKHQPEAIGSRKKAERKRI